MGKHFIMLIHRRNSRRNNDEGKWTSVVVTFDKKQCTYKSSYVPDNEKDRMERK